MDMLEKIARALMLADIGETQTAERLAEKQDGWDAWLPDARAVLTALLEPTPEMIGAGRDVRDPDDVRVGYWTAEEVFQAMIRKALGE